MTKKPRHERNYIATNGLLNPQYHQNPERQAPPFSRPVLESGTAIKTVYLSRAPQELTSEQLAKALDNHTRKMQAEIQASGRIVRRVIKTVAGLEGDVRIQMMWEILGSKPTKHYRRNHAKIDRNGPAVDADQGSPTEPGRTQPQADSETGPVPL